ncbi:MAG: signal peptidase I [Clostridia bacterium]|nr:signal peptidase I [Clostridia bacterium]
MNGTMKKIWNIATWVIVAAVVILALMLVGARVIGMQVFTVLSGSMEPEYHTGSIIYVTPIEDPTTIEVKQVITFMLDENTVATHRVIEVIGEGEELRFRTKGDANNTEDGTPVHYKNIIGTPVFTIPYLGYVANFIQNPPGTYIAVAVGVMLLLLVFLPDLMAKSKDDDEDDDEDLDEDDEELEAVKNSVAELEKTAAVAAPKRRRARRDIKRD